MGKKNKYVSYECNSLVYSPYDVSSGSWLGVFDGYSSEQLSDMIKRPMENNKILRHLSRHLYSGNGIVRNTIDYMTAIPALDFVITNTSKSRSEKKLVQNVLETIKHKEFIRDALLNGMIDGIAFYYFDTGEKIPDKKKFLSQFDTDSITEINSQKSEITVSIVTFPTDYCKIIGIRNNYYVVSFDLNYFSIGSESSESKLKKYPKEIRDGYSKYISGTGKQFLVLDCKKTIVHKISSNKIERWGRPLVLPAIADILYSDYFTSTKRNVLNNLNNQIIYQTYPEGKTAGTSSLTTKQQEEQHNTVRDAVVTKNNRGGITFFSVASGTKIESIKTDTSIFDDKNESDLTEKIGTDLGFASSLLSASGDTSFSAQQTNLELVTSQVFSWIEGISNELNKVINFNVLGNKTVDAKVNYLPITHLNRKEMIGYAKDLYLSGRGSLTFYASCVGLSEEVFYSMLDDELENNIENKYPVHRTSYTQSSDDKAGRPENDNPTNENTVKSKSNNSNNIPKAG